MTHWRLTVIALACMLFSACASGPPRRVSEPTASIQQLTVRTDGSWSVDLRLQNYSSVPMRFAALSLAVSIGDEAAGTLQAQPALAVGPESADVVTVALAPTSSARILLADRLAAGSHVDYRLQGTVEAGPEDRASTRTYTIARGSRLSPVPGLPGVLR
jgi:LEA14-like dessication related protein